GGEEQDCGDTARRLGDEATFIQLAQKNIEALSGYDFRVIVTADPHVLNTLKNEYPDRGGHYRVMHHTEYLAELLDSGRLHVTNRQKGHTVTYHDPCYLARYNGIIEAPRRILVALDVTLVEMARSKENTQCCGAGGGAALTDVPGKFRVPDRRMAHAIKTGASTLAVACPNCAVMF